MKVDEKELTQIGEYRGKSSIVVSSGTSTFLSSPADDEPRISSPASLPPLVTLSIESCVYRGEGNANIVIALPHERKVIRLRKSLPGVASAPDGGEARARREVEFVRDVVSGFLGSYAQVPEILRYDGKDIARLSEAIRSFRPENRRHKVIADACATKYPDYAFLLSQRKFDAATFRSKSTFCVEIKPKQGYLRKAERRFQKCPYCLMQYYKLNKRIVSSRNSYCPLDLFSGNRERMGKALKGLLKSPQNNLKIFKDGIVVYDQASSSSGDLDGVLADWFRSLAPSTPERTIETFCDLVCSALLRPFHQDELSNPLSAESTPFSSQDQDSRLYVNSDLVAKTKKLLYFVKESCNFEGQVLPKDSVLERIFRMQRLCDNTERVYNIYNKYSALLTDEMVYSDFTRMPGTRETIPSGIVNAVPNHESSAKRKHSWVSRKKLAASNKIYKDDPNGNQLTMPIGTAWSTEEDENIGKINFTSSTQSRRISKSACKQKSYSRENEDYADKRTNNVITIENVSTLRDYLLFCTARDCSILMAFQELNPHYATNLPQKNVLDISEETSFYTHIGISDLDPKSIHCIEKHHQRDIDVLNSAIRIIEDELAMKNE